MLTIAFMILQATVFNFFGTLQPKLPLPLKYVSDLEGIQ